MKDELTIKTSKKEDELITFKTAKLAKEKGFDWECLHFYCINSTCDYIESPYKYSFEVNANQDRDDNFGYGKTWSAPTQSLLQKFLRDVHNIHINICPHSCYTLFLTEVYMPTKTNPTGYTPIEGVRGNTYEEALEKVLYRSLSLIKVTNESK